MKKLLRLMVVGIFLFATNPLTAQQTITTPRASSPAAEVSQTIGLTKITLNYSRPSVTNNGNDRSGKIYGTPIAHWGLTTVGFGAGNPIPWRAGANENTTINFTHDVKIEGKKLKAGTYGLHVMLAEDGDDVVIFSNTTGAWGSYFYDEKEDALRVQTKAEEIPHTETLTYNFLDITPNSTKVVLDWEKRRIPFTVEVNTHEIVLANAREELKSTQSFGWQGPLSAATYCATNNVNHEEALGWVDQSIALQSNWQNLSTKGQLLTQMGKTEEAEKVMEQALEVGAVFQIHGYGRQLITAGKKEKAMEVFKMNASKNPDTWPVNVGLMRGYSANGDFKNALKHAELALKNVPEGDQLNKGSLEAAIEKLKNKEDVN